MSTYQVAIVGWPERWQPECSDDVPLELIGPVEVLMESDDLFAALDRVIGHNESAEAQRRGRWAVVVEPGGMGRVWPAARLCTPVVYKVTSIWWPNGWEPNSALDVPNCVWKSQEQVGGEWFSYPQAETTVLALNRQYMDHPGATWHVVVAVENEPISRTVSHDSSGMETTVEVRRMHIIRPGQGGRGECSCCPAHAFQCAKADWSSQTQTVATRHSRAVGTPVM